jgi:hypothetical protein
MRWPRASHGGARPLNCGVGRQLGELVRGRILGQLAYAVAALVAAPGARSQLPLPDAVEEVIAEAEARSDPGQRWAFTRTYTRGDETIVARYDPRRPAGEEWRLITPASKDALTKDQRGVFKDTQVDSGPMADRTLMFTPSKETGQGLRQLLHDLTVIEDGPGEKRYAFRFPEELPEGADEEHGWLMKHVDGEFAIAANEPWLFSIHLFAPEPFGVAGVVRLTKLEDTTRYGEVEPGGPIAALRNDNHQIGRLFLVRVDDRRVTVNSDFERVEVQSEEGDRPGVE